MACQNFDNAVSRIAVSGIGPLEVEGDAGRVKQRPMMDLIAAANYLAGICAAKTPNLGVRYRQLIPGGTVQARFRTPRFRDGGEV